MTDTVKVRIEIQISTEGEHDTGITIDEWNAMSDADRAAFVWELWKTDAGDHDNGGMWVTTDGATAI